MRRARGHLSSTRPIRRYPFAPPGPAPGALPLVFNNPLVGIRADVHTVRQPNCACAFCRNHDAVRQEQSDGVRAYRAYRDALHEQGYRVVARSRELVPMTDDPMVIRVAQQAEPVAVRSSYTDWDLIDRRCHDAEDEVVHTIAECWEPRPRIILACERPPVLPLRVRLYGWAWAAGLSAAGIITLIYGTHP